MHRKFDHESIEKKWQGKWKESGIYNVGDRDTSKEKKYVLVEWPYPSGNLHVGHWFAFAVVDIYVRAQRMQGKQVLFPIGFDAFGLPAENAAIKRDLDPKQWTDSNIDFMRTQLESMGNAFSWDKTASSTDPEYYKWTQWMFGEFFKNDIAYRGTGTVNWCPGCNTVIANEQVLANNTCERSGDTIEKREMPQWMLKITQYADRLIDDLDALEWPEHIKESQRQWIGRSQGAELSFPLNIPPDFTEVVFASNNKGKVERMRRLLLNTGIQVTLKTPEDIGITDFDVTEDGSTLRENAFKKAHELRKLTTLPVLGDDTGFFIDNTEINPVTVKRNALAGVNENDLTIEEIGERMQQYYIHIADEHGGSIDAEWRNGIAFIDTEGNEYYEEAIRPALLTNKVRGATDPYLPIRPIYISKATGKYPTEHTEAEDLIELEPISRAFRKLLSKSVTVFTTRPDTLYGATYVVLAPDHDLVLKHKDVLRNWDEISAYQQVAAGKDDMERTNATKEKTGVKLIGITATNPATGEAIPVYIADYVLKGYGTGAIMAVPAHDERDFAFAEKFGLQVTDVVADLQYYSSTSVGAVLISKDGKLLLQKKDSQAPQHANKITTWGGGMEKNETPLIALARELMEELELDIATDGVTTRIMRMSPNIGPLYIVENVDASKLILHEGEAIVQVASLLEIPTDDRASHIKDLLDSDLMNIFTQNGVLINSSEFDGMDSEEAKAAITKKVGGKLTNTYRLRDWSIGRQRYWGVPIPIVYDPEGKAHPIPKEHLPWLLPTDVDFKPTGVAPLAKSIELKERTERIFGKGWTPEVETMDTFVDSSWYFLRYLDAHNDDELSSQKAQDDWMPIDIYFGGAEHTTMHLLYSRFWQKVLYDLKLVKDSEPYIRRINRGLVLGPDGNKMSKSKGNVIDPDEHVKRLGADTVKMYLAFMGPYGELANYPWDMGGIAGIRRFLERVYGLSDHIIDEEPIETKKLLNMTIAKVTADIEAFKFNTGISACMIFVNHVEKQGISHSDYKDFLRLLAPFAPHITEELWHEIGESGSIHNEALPVADLTLSANDEVVIAVQINGKMKGTIRVGRGTNENDVLEKIRNSQDLSHKMNFTPSKIIFVQNKIINIIP